MTQTKNTANTSTAPYKTTHIRPDLHARLKVEAAEMGISLREHIDQKLSAPVPKKSK